MQTFMEKPDCSNLIYGIPALLAVGICILIISTIIWRNYWRNNWQKIPGLITTVKTHIFRQNLTMEDRQEVDEFQVSKELADIRHLMALIKEQQSRKVLQLHHSYLESYERLQADVQLRLEEDCLRSDQNFERLHKMVGSLPRSPHTTEASTQTQPEFPKKWREVLEKDDTVEERGHPRSIIPIIRTALMEFLKDLKLKMSLQKDEAMSDLKNVFEQTYDDKHDLKNTIESAFSTATLQTQTNFLQFDSVGSSTVPNQNNEIKITTKFQEYSGILSRIIEQLMTLNFDVSYIKRTLDNIDGQFDEIYKKLVLGSQKNADHSEEVARSLKDTAQDWNEKSSQSDETCKRLQRVTHGMKDILGKLENAVCNGQAGTIDNLSNRNPATFELEHDNIGVLLMTVQVCQEKMVSMKDQFDKNSRGVRQSAELLLDKLQFLTNLVKNSVETLKSLTIAMPDSENQRDESFKQEQVEFGDDILGLETITEVTEEDQDDKEWGNREMPVLMKFIDANLDMARYTKYIGDITKNSEFFNNTLK